MCGKVAVEPVVDLQHEHVLPINIDVLRVFEVVGEELELRVEIDVLGQRILELGHGAGTKLITDLGIVGVDDGVVLVQLIDAEGTDGGQIVIVHDGDTACDGREIKREVRIRHPFDTKTQADVGRGEELGDVLGGVFRVVEAIGELRTEGQLDTIVEMLGGFQRGQ